MAFLETNRLVLSHLRQDDATAMLSVVGDRFTMIHYPRPLDRGVVDSWIEQARAAYATRGLGLFGVSLRDTGEFIGDCGFLFPTVDGQARTELGYHIGRRWWNQGYATEAAAACLRYAADKIQGSELISLILPYNLQSRRVAEKNGATVARETDYKGLHHVIYVYPSLLR
jgi:RimJ/RimL family protein N-acetyltransferase